MWQVKRKFYILKINTVSARQKYQNNLLTASKWQGFELFYKGNRRAYHKLQAYKKNRMNLWRLLKKFSMVTEGHCTFLDSLG